MGRPPTRSSSRRALPSFPAKGSTKMKAIRVHEFGGPEVLKLEEVPAPAPAADEVLINVKAVGINPVETYLRSGSNPKLPRPYTPGLDAAGIVESVGAEVTNLKA